MNRLTALISFYLIVLFWSCAPVANQKDKAPVVSFQKELRHVVLFKFKDGVAADSLKAMETAFRDLATQIKEVKHLESGLNNSPENLNQGFTHCFVVTFTSEADRAVYLPHPAHKAFVAKHLSTALDKVCVVDFWSDVAK